MKLLAIPLFELYDNAARYVLSCVFRVLILSDIIDAGTGHSFLLSLTSSLGASPSLSLLAPSLSSIIYRYNFIYQ